MKTIDNEKLAEMVRRKRNTLNLRDAAKEIDISAPTLNRIEQGQLPDIDTYIKICRWLNVSTEFFTIHDNENNGESIESQVVGHLRADKTLPKETAEALIKMINIAYQSIK